MFDEVTSHVKLDAVKLVIVQLSIASAMLVTVMSDGNVTMKYPSEGMDSPVLKSKL